MGNIAELYGNGFNTDVEDIADGFDILPAGWYSVEVEKAEIKDTKAGTGKYLHLQMVIIGEHFANRKLFTNINLINPNEKAVQIGQRELAALGQACGLSVLSDTDELLGKNIQVRVKVKKDGNGVADNAVTAYKVGNVQQSIPAQNTVQTPAHQAQPTPQATTPAPIPVATEKKRPWEM